jgi:hypothetical protein
VPGVSAGLLNRLVVSCVAEAGPRKTVLRGAACATRHRAEGELQGSRGSVGCGFPASKRCAVVTCNDTTIWRRVRTHRAAGKCVTVSALWHQYGGVGHKTEAHTLPRVPSVAVVRCTAKDRHGMATFVDAPEQDGCCSQHGLVVLTSKNDSLPRSADGLWRHAGLVCQTGQ